MKIASIILLVALLGGCVYGGPGHYGYHGYGNGYGRGYGHGYDHGYR